MRIQIKRLIFTLGFIAGIVFSGLFFLKPPGEPLQRGPASEEVIHHSTQMKIQMIQSLSWKNQDGEMEVSIVNGLEDLCERWQKMQVVVQADGIAVSGTPPQVMFYSSCEKGQFNLQFSNDLNTWGEDRQSFLEVGAEQFFVSNIVLSGPLGTMNIQSPEILSHLNQSFDFQKR